MDTRRRAPRRSALIDPDHTPRPVFVLEEAHGATRGRWHVHRRAQLVHAAEGVVTVSTPGGKYVAPPQRAVWIPSGMRHAVASRRPYRLLTLYAEPEIVDVAPVARVLAIDPLVEQLLLAAAGFGGSYPASGPEARLVQVIVDRMRVLEAAPLHLPEPSTPALAAIAVRLVDDPSDDRTLARWCARSGMSTKTAARRFEAETGMTFGRWRTQLRMLAALERLGAGESVTSVAFDVGYRDVSSFIAAFKRTLGETPARYFRHRVP